MSNQYLHEFKLFHKRSKSRHAKFFCDVRIKCYSCLGDGVKPNCVHHLHIEQSSMESDPSVGVSLPPGQVKHLLVGSTELFL